jgi:hypothetical protein
MTGAAKVVADLNTDPEADELVIAEQLWPTAREMAEDEAGRLLAGVQQHPFRVGQLCRQFPARVRACFIGIAGVDMCAKLEEIRHCGGGGDDWLRGYADDRVVQEIARINELSVRPRALCGQHGLAHVEASGEATDAAAAVLDRLTGVGCAGLDA